MTPDLTPIFYLVRDPVVAAGVIGDAISEGRISMPDDFPHPADLSDAIVHLVHQLHEAGFHLTCNCACDCDDAACHEVEHRTCAWHMFHCPYEGND